MGIKTTKDKDLTVSDAAFISGLSRYMIQKLVKCGEIPHRKEPKRIGNGFSYIIKRSDLKRYTAGKPEKNDPYLELGAIG